MTYLTIGDVAARLNVTRRAVERYMSAGLLSFVQIADRRLVTERALGRFKRPLRGQPSHKAKKGGKP